MIFEFAPDKCESGGKINYSSSHCEDTNVSVAGAWSV